MELYRKGSVRVWPKSFSSLMWDLPCVQQASYLEGGPLMWMLPQYLHVDKKSDDDDDGDVAVLAVLGIYVCLSKFVMQTGFFFFIFSWNYMYCNGMLTYLIVNVCIQPGRLSQRYYVIMGITCMLWLIKKSRSWVRKKHLKFSIKVKNDFMLTQNTC